jgi:RimJ/RimL family protein N-acetyltransferase
MIITNPIMLNLPMPISTKRLTIRPMMPGDGHKVFELIDESRNEFKKWFHWVNSVQTWQDSEKTTREFYSGFILRKTFNFVIFKGSTLIGLCSFNDPNFEIPSCALGYCLNSNMQGNGYMQEAVSAITLYAFKQIGFKRVIILCNNENERSINLAERLDFKLELVAKGLISKPGDDNLILSRSYVRFDIEGLTNEEVSW